MVQQSQSNAYAYEFQTVHVNLCIYEQHVKLLQLVSPLVTERDQLLF